MNAVDEDDDDDDNENDDDVAAVVVAGLLPIMSMIVMLPLTKVKLFCIHF